ncbi:hypothetical protein X777_02030 [Ooceraea biroi]|uniref:Gag-like protein n=1 Tax=Ooceraea biroi TaxID=2015173 RepID=A0A026WPS5_OOCBI|nr:hypothetical protein X777_02030 [Ooceraea biroi]
MGSFADPVSDAESVASSVSFVSRGGTKRKGRPTTSGDYSGLAQKKKALAVEQERLVGTRLMARALDISNASPSSRSSENLPSVEDLRRDLRDIPTAAVGATAVEQLGMVEKVALGSKNLKGTWVRMLRMAARSVEAAVSELTVRKASGTAAEMEETNNRLRKEIQDLRAEVAQMRVEIGVPRGRVSTHPGPPSPSPRRTRTPTSRETMEVELAVAAPGPRPPAAGDSGPRPPLTHSTKSLEDSIMERVGQRIAEEMAALRRLIFPPEQRTPPPREGAQKALPPERTPLRRQEEAGQKGGGGKKGARPPPFHLLLLFNPQPQRSGGRDPLLLPPPPPYLLQTTSAAAERWVDVVGRRERRATKKAVRPPSAPKTPATKAAPKKGQTKGDPVKAKLPKLPRTAAVRLTALSGKQEDLAEAITLAKQQILLEALGITEDKSKRAVTGGLIMQIPGQDAAAKADAFASKLEELLKEKGVRVARPSKRTEIRISGLDDSITPEEVADAVAKAGGCPLGDIKTGAIRSSPFGLGALWVQCPLAAARKVVAEGKLRVGWVAARVEALPPAPCSATAAWKWGIRGSGAQTRQIGGLAATGAATPPIRQGNARPNPSARFART